MGNGRRSVFAVVLVGVAVAATGYGIHRSQDVGVRPPRGESSPTAGVVLDSHGRPVAGARVSVAGGTAVSTAADGGVSLGASAPALVTVSAPGFRPRAAAVQPGQARPLVLSPDDGRVTLRFGGDVMAGRRFYDPDSDGDTSDSLVSASSVDSHRTLLRYVEPLLRDADMTIVNLETPLLDNPPTGLEPTRDRRLHPTKEYVFASSPALASALKEVGVDAVDLGNNHFYDGLERGVERTLRALDDAGLKHFGGGRNLDEAWHPLRVQVHGQSVAFIGCTTITGVSEPITYVATESKGGAAGCDKGRLRQAVTASRQLGAEVVVMIHGGVEYQRDQSALVQGLTQVALDAGAVAVMNGHPHVVGAIREVDRAVVAETLGNLLFDQTVWSTLPSYLACIELLHGAVARTTVDPIWHDGFVPRPVTGHLADVISRIASSAAADPAVADTGSDADSAATTANSVVALPAGAVSLLPAGHVLRPTGLPSGQLLRSGEDLLFSGGFEDDDVDAGTPGGLGWEMPPGSHLSQQSACGGSLGALLTAANGSEAALHPHLRQFVEPGDHLTLAADVADVDGSAALTISWFPDSRGPSSSEARLPFGRGEHCRQVRLDVTVPAGILAAEPAITLTQADGSPARASVDNVRLVRWSPTPGSRDAVVELTGAAGIPTLMGSYPR